MDNSNDLRAPLRRLMEDVRSHYEVTYSPVSSNFDGHFRKLTLRFTRPGVTSTKPCRILRIAHGGWRIASPF